MSDGHQRVFLGYDAAGNRTLVETHTLKPDGSDANLKFDTFGHDAMNRQTSGDNRSVTYDLAGRVSTQTVYANSAPSHVDQYRYDTLGRLQSTLRDGSATIQWRQYDRARRVVYSQDQSFADGRQGAFIAAYTQYDALGQVRYTRSVERDPDVFGRKTVQTQDVSYAGGTDTLAGVNDALATELGLGSAAALRCIGLCRWRAGFTERLLGPSPVAAI